MAKKQTRSDGGVFTPVDPPDIEGSIGRTEAQIKDRPGIDRGAAGSKPGHGRAATVDEDNVGKAERGDDVGAGER